MYIPFYVSMSVIVAIIFLAFYTRWLHKRVDWLENVSLKKLATIHWQVNEIGKDFNAILQAQAEDEELNHI